MLGLLRRGAGRIQRAAASGGRGGQRNVELGVAASDTDILAVTAQATGALEDLSVPYAVVGSLASIAYGEPRLTVDADIIADIDPAQVVALVTRWEPQFFADGEAVRRAAAERGHFNLLHRDTMVKVDVYVRGGAPWVAEQLARRQRLVDGDVALFVISPEDVVLSKLAWYLSGGEVSDRQWRDVLGVLVVQRGALDEAYMHRWADTLGVAELLERALALARG